MASVKRESTLARIAIYTILLLMVVIVLYPVLRVINISLRPEGTLLSTSLALLPDNASLSNYWRLLSESNFLVWLRNSALVALAVTMVGVGLASTAGYAFSRYRFPGRQAGMLALLTTQMFPVTMLLLPLFIVLVKLNLYNSFLGLVVAYSATALPFCVWQMKGYYDTIPASLEEAARIDGASQFQTFYKIVLPLARPALAITALFSFMSAWSEYLVAAVILTRNELYTLPIGLKHFQANLSSDWGLYAAGSLIMSIPVVILFLAVSRALVSGLTLGSVKG
jgi:arabinogalactan oligomer/maltooligosaccharide transport system permease protein